jgi:hypothetical protein
VGPHTGKVPKKGSQYRQTCEPAGHVKPGGKWSSIDGPVALTDPPPGPYCRDLTPPVQKPATQAR